MGTTTTTTDLDDLDDLIITQDEINGLIGRSDFLRGRAYVTLEDGSMYEEHCLPADKLPGGKGRSFVGDGYIHLQGEDQMEVMMETAAKHHEWFDGPVLFAQIQYLMNEKGSPEVYLMRGSIFGYEASQDCIDQHINLLEDLYDGEYDKEDDSSDDFTSEDVRAILDGIESVRIHPGKIVFHP